MFILDRTNGAKGRKKTDRSRGKKTRYKMIDPRSNNKKRETQRKQESKKSIGGKTIKMLQE